METNLSDYLMHVRFQVLKCDLIRLIRSRSYLFEIANAIFYGPQAEAVRVEGKYDVISNALIECYRAWDVMARGEGKYTPRKEKRVLRALQALATWTDTYFPRPKRKSALLERASEIRTKFPTDNTSGRLAEHLELIASMLSDNPPERDKINTARDGRTAKIRGLVTFMRAGDAAGFNKFKKRCWEPDMENVEEEGRVYITNVDLQHLDLRGFDLQYVDLSGSRLDGANLEGVELNHVRVRHGTSFFKAKMRGAKLNDAWLNKATFSSADLRETSWKDVFVTECLFFEADLRGSSGLERAEDLESARFNGARVDTGLAIAIAERILRTMKIFDGATAIERRPKIHFSKTRSSPKERTEKEP